MAYAADVMVIAAALNERMYWQVWLLVGNRVTGQKLLLTAFVWAAPWTFKLSSFNNSCQDNTVLGVVLYAYISSTQEPEARGLYVLGYSEMILWTKRLAAKPDDLSLIPGTQTSTSSPQISTCACPPK